MNYLLGYHTLIIVSSEALFQCFSKSYVYILDGSWSETNSGTNTTRMQRHWLRHVGFDLLEWLAAS